MSEHEFWNELGNVYFISGAYEPAIHAYARSIELNRNFGRPYSNMALAFVHIGRYPDAIELYHRSIELLNDVKEKAITWNRLGILYRQVKDYQSALVAYEQADKLDARQDDEREGASRDVKYPLFVSMPPIDLNTILERPQEPEAFEEVNEQLEAVETQRGIDWFDGNFVPPNPIEEPVIEAREAEAELVQELTASMEEDGWIPLIFEEAIPVSAPFEMVMQPVNGSVEESTTSSWGAIIEETPQEEAVHQVAAAELNILNEEPAVVSENEGDANQWTEAGEYQVSDGLLVHPDEIKTDEPANEPAVDNQWAEMNGYQIISELIAGQEAEETGTIELGSNELVTDEVFENVSLNISDFREEQAADETVEATEAELPFEHQSVDLNEDVIAGESNVHSTDATHPMEYAQVEYPLVELSPAEIDSIHIDIARFKRIIQINPRNAFAHDTLGGLYKALGQFKDAITSYQQAISLDSTKPSYFYQLGLMYSAEKRNEEARDAFLRVLSMDPHHILANASLGSHYRKLGLSDLAQKHIDIALQNVYEEENEYNQACLEAICGNTERALELLQVAIEDNPSYINWAQHDPDLETLRHDGRFYMLVQSYAQNK